MSIILAFAMLATCADSQGCGGQPATPQLEAALINLESALEEVGQEMEKKDQSGDKDIREAEAAGEKAKEEAAESPER